MAGAPSGRKARDHSPCRRNGVGLFMAIGRLQQVVQAPRRHIGDDSSGRGHSRRSRNIQAGRRAPGAEQVVLSGPMTLYFHGASSSTVGRSRGPQCDEALSVLSILDVNLMASEDVPVGRTFLERRVARSARVIGPSRRVAADRLRDASVCLRGVHLRPLEVPEPARPDPAKEMNATRWRIRESEHSDGWRKQNRLALAQMDCPTIAGCTISDPDTLTPSDAPPVRVTRVQFTAG